MWSREWTADSPRLAREHHFTHDPTATKSLLYPLTQVIAPEMRLTKNMAQQAAKGCFAGGVSKNTGFTQARSFDTCSWTRPKDVQSWPKRNAPDDMLVTRSELPQE
jgi:hypothetical protein